MVFEFIESVYRFNTRWSGTEQRRGLKIIEEGIINRTSRTEVYQQLVDEGLGYRKQDVLKDLSRAYAVEQSLSQGARERAVWYADTMEEIQARVPSHTVKEAQQFFEKWRADSKMTVVEAATKAELEAQDYTKDTPEALQEF